MSLTTSPLDELIRRIRNEAAWQSPADRGVQEDLGDAGPMRLAPSRPVEEQLRRPKERMHVHDFYLIDNPKDFVRFAYRALLLRSADIAGFDACCQALEDGFSRAAIIRNLRRSDEGRIADVRLDGFALAWLVWLAERLLRKCRLPALARRVAAAADAWFAGQGSADADESRTRVAGDLAVLRLVESWRMPLETHSGRTAVLERELRVLRDTVSELDRSVQVLRSELQYARHSPASSATHATHLGMHTSISELPNQPAAAGAGAATAIGTSDPALDAYYVAFEDANRGSHDEFIAKLSVYAGVFESLQASGRGPLLDIGCGRGELLDYLRGLGVKARGVDANPAMASICRERGHIVEHADALALLRSLPAASLGAVSGFHIIEHLPFDVLFYLVAECRRVLQPGGFILFETPNPENVLVGSHTFYHDFTHRNPVTPTAIQFLARYHDFTDLKVIRSSPYPDSAKVPGDDPLTRRVNGHLLGPQDFALLAYTPGKGAGSAAVATATSPDRA